MIKIVTNRRHGGFGLSDAAFERYLDLKGITWHKWKAHHGFVYHATVSKEEFEKLSESDQNKVYLSPFEIVRDDPILVQVVKDYGKDANGRCAELEITEIPDGVDWEIEDYDGMEWVSEKHRMW